DSPIGKLEAVHGLAALAAQLFVARLGQHPAPAVPAEVAARDRGAVIDDVRADIAIEVRLELHDLRAQRAEGDRAATEFVEGLEPAPPEGGSSEVDRGLKAAEVLPADRIRLLLQHGLELALRVGSDADPLRDRGRRLCRRDLACGDEQQRQQQPQSAQGPTYCAVRLRTAAGRGTRTNAGSSASAITILIASIANTPR